MARPWKVSRKRPRVQRETEVNYDRRHRARPLSPPPEETEVWIRTGNERLPGKVTSTAYSPRSYWVETSDGGQLQRNRAHLNVRRRESPKQINQSVSLSPSERSTTPTPVVTSMPNRIITRSRTGTATNPPDRYRFPRIVSALDQYPPSNSVRTVCFCQ